MRSTSPFFSSGRASCEQVPDALFFRHVTFICGRSGIYALGAAAAKHAENSEDVHYFVGLLREVCAFIDDLFIY
jgi:hypothetical protein